MCNLSTNKIICQILTNFIFILHLFPSILSQFVYYSRVNIKLYISKNKPYTLHFKQWIFCKFENILEELNPILQKKWEVVMYQLLNMVVSGGLLNFWNSSSPKPVRAYAPYLSVVNHIRLSAQMNNYIFDYCSWFYEKNLVNIFIPFFGKIL